MARLRLRLIQIIRASSRNLATFSVLLCLVMIAPTAQAQTLYSIATSGRFATLSIEIRIPLTPKWAHDVVLNATIAWNQARIWYQREVHAGPAYRFIESNKPNVTVSFTIPSLESGFARGWTSYNFAHGSVVIASAQIYLDQKIFSADQEHNSTDRRVAFRIALHELGHVLGLGEMFDGRDVMDPRGNLDATAPLISTLDLYTIQLLASSLSVPAFVNLPSNITDQTIDAYSLLAGYTTK